MSTEQRRGAWKIRRAWVAWLGYTVVELGFGVASLRGEPLASDPRYGDLPLHFELNQGQADAAARFLCRARGLTLFLTPEEAVLKLGAPRENPAIVHLQIVGASRHPRLLGEGLLPTRSHYFLGK